MASYTDESICSKIIKINSITEKCCEQLKKKHKIKDDINKINDLIADKIADYIKFSREFDTYMQDKLENDLNKIINKYPNHYIFGNKSIDRISVITNEIERYSLNIIKNKNLDEKKTKELDDYITDYICCEMKKYLDKPNTITTDELIEFEYRMKGIINNMTNNNN